MEVGALLNDAFKEYEVRYNEQGVGHYSLCVSLSVPAVFMYVTGLNTKCWLVK